MPQGRAVFPAVNTEGRTPDFTPSLCLPMESRGERLIP